MRAMSNESRREKARAAGLATYRCEVTDTWPACTTCGDVIRRPASVNRPGLYRLCGCQGIVWRSAHIVGEGWLRMTDEELT